MSLDFKKLDKSVLEPARRSVVGPEGGSHFVYLYEDDESLVDAVTTFLAQGIKSGDIALVIARPDHVEAFEAALRASGLDLAEGWRTFDSSDLLATFMVDGMPVPSLFMESIGGLVQSAGPHGNVRVFGEMVADLWTVGHIPAAMRVEELWNDLASIMSFELFCAYPASVFRAADLLPLSEVCRQHTQVIPPTVKELP
jgi:hypothetical protein